MNNEFYTTDSILVLDGAWGTHFQSLGLRPGNPPELWNSDNRQAVRELARAYVAAGSDIILTNTFGANRITLGRHGLSDKSTELATLGAEISREAARSNAKVFGSVGPTGKMVMLGELSHQEIMDAFCETARALQTGGAEAIVLETFNEIAELQIALRAVKEATNLPVVACMTFASGPDYTRTLMGESPADFVKMAHTEGAEVIGTNCGRGPDHYPRLVELLRDVSDLPIWVRPNAGMPRTGPDGKMIFPIGPDEFASYAPGLISTGANFIGGCCGTTPAHVKAIRRLVDQQSD